MENALPETAFFVRKDGVYNIRWFTPDIEMDLCGHATLAAAFVISKYCGVQNEIMFESRCGKLSVTIAQDLIELNLPRRDPYLAGAPEMLLKSVNIAPQEVFKSRDYIFLYEREEQIRNLIINLNFFNQINLDPGGLCVTAIGNDSDFVSRFFTPQASIIEDPVTGSAHCSLIPLWSKKLGKKELFAKQISKRGGELECINEKTHVVIKGQAVLYKEGIIFLT